MNFLLNILFLIVAEASPIKQQEESVLVNTLDGPVLGRQDSGFDDRFGIWNTWNSFLGIPFASPPIGNRRFLAPVSPEKWTSPLDTTEFENITCACFADLTQNYSSENCLYLRVYVPQTINGTVVSGPLPVMIWLHGGGFQLGSGTDYGPLYWMSHGIVLVTINYRLGPLGFMSLGTQEVSGNMGMKDQRMAFEWVRDNIASFQGNPNEVTVAGESAGSWAASYHLYSPTSKGLYNKIIGQSGFSGFSASFHQYSAQQAKKYGERASELVGCSDPATRLECLQEIPLNFLTIVDLPMELMSQPSVDGFSEDAFMPMDPVEATITGNYNTEVDLLIGANQNEGQLITQFLIEFPILYSVVAAAWDFLGPFSLFFRHHTEITEEDINKSNMILDHYVGGIHNLNAIHFDNITDMWTDSFFWSGIDTFLDNHLKYSQRQTFQYIYSHVGDYHLVMAPGLNHSDIPGTSHSDELYLMWEPFMRRNHPLNESDTTVSRYFTTMWTNFIKYGNPTPPNHQLPTYKYGNPSQPNHQLPVSWNPLTSDDRRYLRIDDEMKMEYSENYRDRMQFWKSLHNIF